MNDPYMKIEKDLLLVRNALECISKLHFPIHIITKGNLVLRDLDLLKEISKIYSAVSITITTADDDLSRVIEPGAPISSERFKVIKTLSSNGIYCGVVLTPVLPHITDSPENIKTIITKAANCGAKYILGWMGMTLRSGQREYFYNKLNKHFTGLTRQYISQFKNDYNCPAPNSSSLNELFLKETAKNNIATKMEHYKVDLSQQQSLF